MSAVGARRRATTHWLMNAVARIESHQIFFATN